ncbi:InlB B-repeat-containing protein [Saccharibacillus alkalitolerans]|uniref:SLH domain-containing protein n=1 Tax=Saccharibacillus alkalitolerans TaxID=2705290 RepID=A0ABX0FDR4_9BACL|nr:InlB B-repeat-containing protein [Saccharibacillus alkalitolerans]NGZ76527.1 hypothetical protein [Saccharibacillus alkalitolerans]
MYPANNQNDYLQDQQTGSGSVSQDIVGDANYPSTYMHFTNEDLSIRMRVSNANGNGAYEFKNFAFVGVDADSNGSVDFFLGAYNPTGNNGRLGIYGSNPAYANTGPSTTGISGKPLLAFKPVKNVNYSIIPTGDGSRFNGDEDYFVSFKFAVADIAKALSGTGINFTSSTPFRFMTGTAAQDNAFNQDLNGMDRSGWSSQKTWNALGVFSNVTSANGSTLYTVNFDSNTGDTEASPAFKTVAAGGNTLGALPATLPTKRGMYFQGWNTKADGTGTSVTAGTPVDANMTAYATWSSKESFTVTFNPNGGTFGTSSAAVTIPTKDGVVGDAMPPVPTQAGSYFVGWSSAQSGTGTWFNASTAVSQNTTVYARWSNNGNKAAKFYNNFTAEGGALITTIYSNGNSNNFNGVMPTITRPGYTLSGWYLSTAPGTVLPPESAITQEGSYYAKWAAATYTVSFVANAGSDPVTGMPAFKSITDGRFGEMPSSEPTREGYQFIEWNRQADGLGEAIYPTSAITANTNVYAIWKAAQTVVFDPNGGDGGTQSIKALSGRLYVLPQPPSREGYTFSGWGTSAGAQTAVDLKDVSGYSTLYAVWSPVYTATFDANGGQLKGGAVSTDILTAYGSVLYLPDDPARTDYVFGGWNTKADGSGTAFKLDTEVTQQPTRVYAKWTPTASAKFTVKFETDGGSAVTDLETNSIETPPTSSKPGYALEGWYKSPERNSADKVSFPYAVTSNQTLYAKWTALNFDVTFDANEGEYADGVTQVPVNETYDQLYVLPNQIPVRSGYTFASWNTQPDGTGVGVTDKTTVVVSVTHSVYAMWTELGKVTINYASNNTNYGTVSRSFESLNPISDNAAGATAIANPGYRFVEWQNAGGTPVSTAETLVPEKTPNGYAAENYTAVFEEVENVKTSLVTLDDNGGQGGSGSVTATYDKAMPAAAAPTRAGYQFRGYYDQKTGGIPYYSADMSSARSWDKNEASAVLYARWSSERAVTGTVIDDGEPAKAVQAAKIQIVRGNEKYGEETLTGPDGKFTIYNIPAGTYNLIMTIGDKTEIIAIRVSANEPVTELGKIIFPLGNASSLLKLKTPETPPVVINNLHPEAEQYLIDENNQGFVKVEMSVAKVDESTKDADVERGVGKIKAQAQEKSAYIGLYLDITLDKYKRATEQEDWGASQGKLKETKGLIEIVVPIPADLQGKTSSLYRVYRDHGNEPTHTIQETKNEHGEYLKVDPEEQTITLYVKKFSVYALAYLTPAAYSVEHYVMNEGGSYPSSPTKTSTASGLADSVLTVSDLQDSALLDSGVTYGYGAVDGATTTTAAVKGDGKLVIKLYYARQGKAPASIAPVSQAPAAAAPTYYDVTFDGAGGTPASVTQAAAAGSLVSKPADPKREGYRFAGWHRADGREWNFNKDRVYSAVTLSAKWIAEAAAPEPPALDKANHFAYMQGYPDRTFAPDRNMTRAEVIVMFSRLLLEKMNVEQAYPSAFRDVAADRWYANAVGYMEQYGIVTGYTDGTFKPDAPVTRAEFAAIASRFDKLAAGGSVTFTDVPSSYWAGDAIASGAAKGWIKGYTDGTFRPDNLILRSEVVTLVNRMLERSADRSYIDRGNLDERHGMKNGFSLFLKILKE